MTNLKTHLFEEHLKANAKMAPFAGWEMPIQYNSVKEEVIAVRENAGVFDVSHMGEFFVEGTDAVSFVDYLLTNEVKSVDNQKAVYSPLCRENGTVIDDLIAYKLSPNKVMICVNAANMQKDWEWFKSQTGNFNCTLTNESDNFSLLALQGPMSEKILLKLEILSSNDNYVYYSAKEVNHKGNQLILARTGYTGEDGFEIFCPHSYVKTLWQDLLNEGAIPCGLASRDILRMEVCYPLYGHEIHDDVTPLDSALQWSVKLNKEKFIGKEALTEYKPKYRLIKLSLDKGIPRAGYTIENEKEETIGVVTSGTMAVTIGKGIAIAHVEKEKFPENSVFFINIRGKKYHAHYHKQPFVTGGHK